ncbi:MAG: cell division protein ZapA [Treponema sp.]|nr:cell division protein ZapA [Treponema sp.]
MGNLQIDILGTSFAIKANEDSEYLNKLLGYYKRIVNQLEESGSLHSPLQISILTGIMLCDELYKEKGRKVKFQTALEKNSTDEEADKITKSLIDKIDQVLK